MTPDQRQRLKQAVDERKRARLFTTDQRGRTILKAGQRDPGGSGIIVPGVKHGGHYAYAHHGCRCDVCLSEERTRGRARRQRQRERAQEARAA